MIRNPFRGRWRITEMEQWDREYRDLVVPAFIEFNARESGEFQFGTVRGWMDCRFGSREGRPLVEFSWDGQSDEDPGCGRGWAELAGGQLRGMIFIHGSDDSSFVAKRSQARLAKRHERPGR